MPLWVSGASRMSTTDPVDITSPSGTALTVAGGATVGGAVEVEGPTTVGSLLVTGQSTFQGEAPSIAVASQLSVGADDFATAILVIGRALDSGSTLVFRDVLNSETFGAIRIDPPSNLMRLEAGAPAVPVLDLTSSGIAPFVRINSSAAQPGFLAYNSAGTNPGAGTHTVVFDAEVKDNAGNFAVNTFTAPVTGDYLFTYTVNYSGAASGTITRLVTTANTYQTTNGSEVLRSSDAVVAPMNAGDTALVQIVFLNAQTISGTDAGRLQTYFSGRLMV